MMTSVFNEIRTWVRGHAQDYILEYFGVLTTRRKDEHAAHIHSITERAAYYYNARPHPSEIAAADAELKRGIDEDWRASVQRYPEVLEYFFSLVTMNIPSDDDPGVRDPPLSALGGGPRKVRLREPSRERDRDRDRRRIPRGPIRPVTAPPPRDGPSIAPSGSRRYAAPPPPGPGYTYVHPGGY
jgi:hypothetical protein